MTALRTPIGRYGGALATVRPDDLASLVIRAIVERSGIDPAVIEDVYFGCANQAGEDNRNVARMAALLAGLPDSVPGCTVNRLCASGLDAVNIAARMIESGHGDVFIAGGTESMSRAPFVMAKSEHAFARAPQIHDTTIGWRFTNPSLAAMYHPYSMGETAENVARKKGDPLVVDTDEHPRPDTTLEKLAGLKPVFASLDQGTVTAGNSSGINDGAAALLLVEVETAVSMGLKPLALVGPSAAAGVDPACMGIGPVPATRKVLARGGLDLDDIDVIELNEAFAAQSLACIRELGLDESKVNPNGGAIAIGHPLGCTGARLVGTLAHEIARTGARRGLATLCGGVGQGAATIIEGVDP